MTITVADFVNARLDEDEDAANRAVSLPWVYADDLIVVDSVDDSAWLDHDAEAHILHFSPARGLLEVAAKRAIIRQAAEMVDCDTAWPEDAEWALRALATVWSDHPDFNKEWEL
ncbi:DUF6221 family protein [Rhodococcus sp. NPDC055024]